MKREAKATYSKVRKAAAKKVREGILARTRARLERMDYDLLPDDAYDPDEWYCVNPYNTHDNPPAKRRMASCAKGPDPL